MEKNRKNRENNREKYQWVAKIAALSGVKPNFGGGGIKARVKKASVMKADKVIKTKRNQKWKILHKLLERRTLCLSSYKNRELNVKL